MDRQPQHLGGPVETYTYKGEYKGPIKGTDLFLNICREPGTSLKKNNFVPLLEGIVETGGTIKKTAAIFLLAFFWFLLILLIIHQWKIPKMMWKRTGG